MRIPRERITNETNFQSKGRHKNTNSTQETLLGGETTKGKLLDSEQREMKPKTFNLENEKLRDKRVNLQLSHTP